MKNELRLGTVFLTNYYTALDFEKNEIIVGINADRLPLAEI